MKRADVKAKLVELLGAEVDVSKAVDYVMSANGEEINITKDNMRAEITKVKEDLDLANVDLKKYQKGGELYIDKEAYDTAIKKMADIETEKTTNTKLTALETALKAKKFNESVIPLILKSKDIDLSKMELDGDTIKDIDNIIKPYEAEYASFITTETKGGAKPAPTGIVKDIERPIATLKDALTDKFNKKE